MDALRSSQPPINLLIVDSNPDDVTLLREAFEEAEHLNSIQVAQTGNEALDAMHNRGEYRTSPSPNLVILGLKLSDLDGYQLLSELKGTPELRHIPVLVMTQSEETEDILRSYDLNANTYIQKPEEIDELVNVAQGIKAFWGEHAVVPPPEP